MRFLLVVSLLSCSSAALSAGTLLPLPQNSELTHTAATETAAAAQTQEAEFWAAFIAAKIPGLSMDKVRPFADILAAAPKKSPLLTYLGLALLAAKRPAESPYFGPDGGARIAQWVSAVQPMEAMAQPSREATVSALLAFDEFARTHTTTLNLNRAADELLISPLAAMRAAQYLHSLEESSELRGRWAQAVSLKLMRHGRNAASANRRASAAGLYLYAHWVLSTRNIPLPQVRFTDMPWKDFSTPLQWARMYATHAAWFHFWPAMDPSATETKAVIDLLNRDPVLARANVVCVLGMIPGDSATFGTKIRADVGMTGKPFHVVAGNPPQWLRTGESHAGEPAVWPTSDPPDLMEARRQVRESRERLDRELANYKESRRFFALDKLRAQLREFDGVRSDGVRAPEVDAAQRALDNARASYSKDLRDGIYVGRSLERADTVYTREMNSMERRTREFEIERMERRLADQQHEARLRHEETVVRSRQRDELTDEIFKAEKLVDTRGHLAKVASIKQAIESHENRYAQLLARPASAASDSGMSAESNARAVFVRARLKAVFTSWHQELLDTAEKSGVVEDSLEALWFHWFFGFPDTGESPGVKTFSGTPETAAEQEARKSRGRPLAESADILLNPLIARPIPGGKEALEPYFPPTPAWRLNQVDGLLNDTWFRFAHEPTSMREQIFVVVKALRKVTQDDAITIETLRPWMRRFVALAPKEIQRVVLSWDSDPQTTRLIEKARE